MIAIADNIKKTVFFIFIAFFFTDGAVLSDFAVSFCITRKNILSGSVQPALSVN